MFYHVIQSEFERRRGPKLANKPAKTESTDLAQRGRRGLGEYDRHLRCHLRSGQPFTQRTSVHGDRLPRTDGNRQATIKRDRESANTMGTGKTTRRVFHVRRSATSAQFGQTLDDVAVGPPGQARRECCAPRAILIVDGYKAKRTCVPYA